MKKIIIRQQPLNSESDSILFDENQLSDQYILWNKLVVNQKTECDPEVIDSEHPLFILYTSHLALFIFYH